MQLIHVLALITMIMSAGALFLAGEALRRARSQEEPMVKGHLMAMRKTLTEAAAIVDNLQKRVMALEKTSANMAGKQSKDSEALLKFQRDLTSAQTGLSEISKILRPRGAPQPRPAAEPSHSPVSSSSSSGRRVA
jgi:hypothetical protein